MKLQIFFFFYDIKRLLFIFTLKKKPLYDNTTIILHIQYTMDHLDHPNSQNNNNINIYDDYSQKPQMAATSDDHIAQTSYMTDNYYEQYPSFSFVNNRHNVHPQPTINAPQDSNNNNIQNIQNISSPLNFPQTNYSDFFRFGIPGFEIIIIPTTSFTNLSNLSMQDLFQQHTNIVVTDESQSQFQQFQQQNSFDLPDSFNINNINNFQ